MTKQIIDLDDVVVKFAGDSGDGIQLGDAAVYRHGFRPFVHGGGVLGAPPVRNAVWGDHDGDRGREPGGGCGQQRDCPD